MGRYIEKLLNVWLILCLGGLAPLVYADTWSAHQGVPVYQLSLFDNTPRALPAELIDQLTGYPAWAIRHHEQLGYQRALPHHSRTLQTELTHGFILLTIWFAAYIHLIKQGKRLPQACSRLSATLPPPDKPPRRLTQPFPCSL